MRSMCRLDICRLTSLVAVFGAAIGGSFSLGVSASPALAEGCEPEWTDPFGLGVNSAVLSLLEHNGDLIVGGRFTQVGELPVNRIARWDGENWHSLGHGLTSDAECPPINPVAPNVAALTVWNGELIAAGIFTASGSQPLGSVARWDGQAWLPFSAPGNDPGCWIEALTVWNGDLIVGGRFGPFTTLEGETIERLARWDGAKWHKFGGGVFQRPGPGNGLVLALAEWNGDLIVGGDFTHVDGVLVNRVARWDGAQWNSMDLGFKNMNCDGVECPTNVQSLVVVNGELYAVGRFLETASDGTFLGSVARWDGEAWQPVGAGFAPTATGARLVPTAASYNNELVVGGNRLFLASPAPMSPAQWVTLGRWDGAQWLPAAGNGDVGDLNHSIHAILEVGDDLILGGNFFAADDVPANRLVTWQGCPAIACPGDLDGDGAIGSSDLAILLGSWGPAGGSASDLTGDGLVGAADLAILLGSWGPCPE